MGGEFKKTKTFAEINHQFLFFSSRCLGVNERFIDIYLAQADETGAAAVPEERQVAKAGEK